MLNFSDAKDDSMPFELQTVAGGVKLILAGRLGVQQARPLWDALQPAMATSQSIRLQAEELEEMDTSIVQILWRLSSQTGQLHIGETSDGFLASLKRRGLGKFFVQPPGLSEPEPKIPPSKVVTKTESRNQRPGHG
jgi:ABC-type transporter Mla MlaB component